MVLTEKTKLISEAGWCSHLDSIVSVPCGPYVTIQYPVKSRSGRTVKIPIWDIPNTINFYHQVCYKIPFRCYNASSLNGLKKASDIKRKKNRLYMNNTIHLWLIQNTNEVTILHENATKAMRTYFRCHMFDMLSDTASVSSNIVSPMNERNPIAMPRLQAFLSKPYGHTPGRKLTMQPNTTMENTYNKVNKHRNMHDNMLLCYHQS